MPTTPLFSYIQKTATQIHDGIIRALKNGLISIGISQPNVGPNSDYDIFATAVANEIAVGQANNIILADQLMPDTASGSFLDRWLTTFGLGRNGAIGSHGNISTPISAASTTVVAGSQLTDNQGFRFQAAVGGTYTADGANFIHVPITAVDTGQATNHVNGDQITWTTAPPFCQAQSTVGAIGGTDGLTGGADSEFGYDEPPRQRLFQLFQNPPKSGNAAHVAGWATASTTAVQAAFVYPALLGPSTVLTAVTSAPQAVGPFSSTSKNRDVPVSTINGTIAPYIAGLVPEHALSVTATAANQPNDIAILLVLPNAPTGSPPGPGGGWIDGGPWPVSISGTAPVTVTTVTSSTNITVNATTAPTAGVSHIAWISPNNWTLYTAAVLSFSGSSGAYVLTLDTPLTGIAAGNYIFPQSVNQQIYFNAVLTGFSALGPGEWAPTALQFNRGFRHPLQTQSWPYNMDSRFLKQIILSSPEVADASFIYRLATTPTVPSSASVPITINSTTNVLASLPPNVFVPRNIGFYSA